MKTTHLGLDDRERALARMRASQLGISVTKYIAELIRKDADEAGLSAYMTGAKPQKVVRRGR